MASYGLARMFGFLGGILVLIGSVFTFFYTLAFAAIERSVREGLAGTATALEQFVFAILLLFFVALSGSRSSEYSMAGGIVLVVVSVIGIVLIGSGVLVLIGFVLTLISGVLFLVRRV
ncbi:MAG TPA: hypothetical protein VN864_07815 [Thermoplasmata archaeon]|nr:hypothetical protein [Thermoplasmata archaeon]